MKIGILTYHKSINYGAVTQCYALCTKIKENFPNDIIEVIDYTPQWRLDFYKVSVFRYFFKGFSKKNDIKSNFNILASNFLTFVKCPKIITYLKKRNIAFKQSLSCLPLSEKKYNYNDMNDLRNKIYGVYDLIIVGSDCVWEWSTIPLPNTYYLFGDYGCKKAAYACTCGTDNVNKLTKEQQKLISNAIKDFSYIGLRDSSTEYMVNNLCSDVNYFHNCDPTTFLDINSLANYKIKVANKLQIRKINLLKPIVCLMGTDKIGKIAHDIFGDNVQYVGVYLYNNYCDFYLEDLEVLEWATFFSFCKITFTTFFHGTMLSLKNLTPVLSFDVLPETSNQITKLHELYNRLGLFDFYIRGIDDLSKEKMEKIKSIAWKYFNEPNKIDIINALNKESTFFSSFNDYLNLVHGE